MGGVRKVEGGQGEEVERLSGVRKVRGQKSTSERAGRQWRVNGEEREG